MAWDDSFYKQDKGKWFIKRRVSLWYHSFTKSLSENSSCPNDSGRITNILNQRIIWGLQMIISRQYM